ncbi:MAG: hypothetical protein KDD35_10090 [Bdellovibrionales bacterium]|nr:hypothetical protein [Bdellovibrionales bacterium]
MSGLRRALDQLKYDRRMIEWNYSEGLLVKEEYEKFLQSLPDLKHRAVELTLEDENKDSESH